MKRKTVKYKGNKHHHKPYGWGGDYLISRKDDVLLVLGDQPRIAQLAQIPDAHLCAPPPAARDTGGHGSLLAAGGGAGASFGGGLLRLSHHAALSAAVCTEK